MLNDMSRVKKDAVGCAFPDAKEGANMYCIGIILYKCIDYDVLRLGSVCRTGLMNPFFLFVGVVTRLIRGVAPEFEFRTFAP